MLTVLTWEFYCVLAAPTYKPSYTRDTYYNSAPRRTEFTTTEYRSIYSPAQPSSHRQQFSAPYQKRQVMAYKNASIGKYQYTDLKIFVIYQLILKRKQGCQLSDFSLRSQTFCYTAEFSTIFYICLKPKNFSHIPSQNYQQAP